MEELNQHTKAAVAGNHFSFESAIERTGKILGILSAVTLSLSVFYDFSFLSALGLDFIEVQTTLSDHLRSAVVWIPPVLVAIAFVMLVELVTRRIEGFKSEEEIVSASKNPEKLRRFRNRPAQFGRVVFTALIIKHALFSTSSSSYYLVFGIGWWLTSMAMITHKSMRGRFSRVTAFTFVLFPTVVCAVGYLGYTKAEKAVRGGASGLGSHPSQYLGKREQDHGSGTSQTVLFICNTGEQ